MDGLVNIILSKMSQAQKEKIFLAFSNTGKQSKIKQNLKMETDYMYVSMNEVLIESQ